MMPDAGSMGFEELEYSLASTYSMMPDAGSMGFEEL